VRGAKEAQLKAPLWIRATVANAVLIDPGFQFRLLEASIHAGGLLVDGYGDLLSVRDARDDREVADPGLRHPARRAHAPDQDRICRLPELRSYALRHPVDDPEDQGTHRPPEVRHHRLSMGCIANGPGEMADADFGYVGGKRLARSTSTSARLR
jgi:(E)-4-hydroxy-3-methylbut-2-enyl-diphosphate synthase